MKRLTLENKDFIFCRSESNTSVYVYEHGTKKGIIRSSYHIQDICIISDVDWILYCLTTEGHLYKINREQVCSCFQGIPSIDEDKDIFSDLLCTETENLEFIVSTEPVYHLSTKNLVHTFDKSNIKSFSVYSNNLLFVVENLHHIEIYLFSGDFSETNVDITFQRQFIVHCSEVKRHLSFIPRLFYIISDLHDGRDILSSDCIKLSGDLFKSLFGSDLVLLNSSIVLFCPVFGSVFYAALKTVYDKNFKSGVQSFRLFCQTSKPVIGVEHVYFPTKWDEETDEQTQNKTQDGIFLACSDGKCILISFWNKCGLQFLPITLPAPIQCVSTHSNFIYHSTERDIYEGEIATEIDTKKSIVTASLTNQISLGQYNVQRIVTLHNQKLVQETPCLVFCQNTNGSCRIVNPSSLKQKTKCLETENLGKQLKYALFSLEKCHIEGEKLKNLKEIQISVISQINIASFLVCSLNKNKIFGHKFTVRYIPHSLQFELNYELTNQSKLFISHDWKLLLSVRHTDSSKTVSVLYSLVDGLSPNECIALSTVLPDQNIYLPFEVEVRIQLEIPAQFEINLPVDFSKILPIFLTSQMVDIIYFLDFEKHQKQFLNQPMNNKQQFVKEIAVSKPISKCQINSPEFIEKTLEPVIFTIHKTVQVLDCKDIRKHGKDELAVLNFLLKDCSQVFDIREKAVPLSLCGGSKVHIGVGIDEEMEIAIQSVDLPLCTAVRLAVLERFETLENKCIDDRAVNESKIQVSFKTYQDILKELQQIEETTELEGTSNSLIQVYRTLRQSQHLAQ